MWNARFAGQELAMCLRSGATEHMIAGEAKDIAAELSDQAWHRLSAEHGTKGERLYEWLRKLIERTPGNSSNIS